MGPEASANRQIQTVIRSSRLTRRSLLGGILGLGSASLLAACDLGSEPTPTSTTVPRPKPSPTATPAVTTDLDRNIFQVSTDERVDVCVGTDQFDTLRVGGFNDEKGLVQRVRKAGYGDSAHEDWSLRGFIRGFERAVKCFKGTPTPASQS